jgi:hypothetical protein
VGINTIHHQTLAGDGAAALAAKTKSAAEAAFGALISAKAWDMRRLAEREDASPGPWRQQVKIL